MIKIELFKTIDCSISGISHGVNKLQIVLKELRETVYWLRLIKKSNLVSITSFDVLIQEARELTNIIAKSIVTVKKGK